MKAGTSTFQENGRWKRLWM